MYYCSVVLIVLYLRASGAFCSCISQQHEYPDTSTALYDINRVVCFCHLFFYRFSLFCLSSAPPSILEGLLQSAEVSSACDLHSDRTHGLYSSSCQHESSHEVQQYPWSWFYSNQLDFCFKCKMCIQYSTTVFTALQCAGAYACMRL